MEIGAGISSFVGKALLSPLTPLSMPCCDDTLVGLAAGAEMMEAIDAAGGALLADLGSALGSRDLGGEGSLLEGPNILAKDIGSLARSFVCTKLASSRRPGVILTSLDCGLDPELARS
jgi:hypothetical protein